jgi:hypothetical protein
VQAIGIAPYDRERHEAFLRVSWCRGARESWDALCSRLRRPDVVCLVAHVAGAPDALLGWCCVQDGAVVWVYVRDLYGKARRRGTAAALLGRAGVDLGEPIACRYWSPAAEAIAAAGKLRLYYAPSHNRRKAA